MADSVSYNWSLQVTKNGDSLSDSGSVTYTPTSIYKGEGMVQAIPNSWTALTWDAATTVAVFAIKNLDATNSVDVAIDNAGAKVFATIGPGRSMGPLPTKSGATYYAKSSASTVNIVKSFDGAS